MNRNNDLYQAEVEARSTEILTGLPPGYRDDNWIGLTFQEHEEGECIQCDAYRLLQRQENDRESNEPS